MKTELTKIIDETQDCGAVRDGGVIYESCSNKELAERILTTKRVIVLPAEIKSKVWGVLSPCGGCECYNEPMKEEYIERCKKCEKLEVQELEFDYELIPEWGKNVFSTRKEASEEIKRRQNT